VAFDRAALLCSGGAGTSDEEDGMADTESSPADDALGAASERDALRDLSRALTTLRLGVPLLDEADHSAEAGSPDWLPVVRAATLTAAHNLGALSGRLIRAEKGARAAVDRRRPGPLS
jgi:hypothetical protein